MAGKHRHSLAGAPSVTEAIRARFRERRDILAQLAQFIANKYRTETDADARREFAAYLDEIREQIRALEANFMGEFAPRYRASAGGGKRRPQDTALESLRNAPPIGELTPAQTEYRKHIAKGIDRTPKVRIGPLKKGTLSAFGYSAKKDAGSRRLALQGAVKQHGKLHVEHKLNAVAVLHKNKAPHLSKIFRADQQWVQSSPMFKPHNL